MTAEKNAAQDPKFMRTVVSFVARGSRFSTLQERAWNRHAADWVVDVPRDVMRTSIHPEHRFDTVAAFGRPGGLIVEIGSGMGETLAAAAAARPEQNFLALEVFKPGIAQTLHRLAEVGAQNARLMQANAVEAFDTMFEGTQIDEVWTFFPDPWHKSRHHKRRLVQPDFAALVASRVVPGTLWRLATDWEDYAEHMAEVLDRHPDWENVDGVGARSPRFATRPLTKFEQRGLDAGRTIADFTFRRR
ncbi:tRNA (guanosine(46)-N7)-methyltransferase TrmB [Micrococcales bacterium 31B]|nr:tRNA (guanosine(46)-N7)-methyltransferase TrmB [Micrococcales bacterium 31B]